MKSIVLFYRDAMRTCRKEFRSSVLWLALVTLIQLAVPLSTRLYLEAIETMPKIGYVSIGTLIYILYLLFANLMNVRWYMLLNRFGKRYLSQLTGRLQHAVSHTSLLHLDQFGLERLKHTLYYDSLTLFRVIGHHASSVIASGVLLVIVFFVSLLYHPALSGMLFFALCLGLAFSLLSRSVIRKNSGRVDRSMKELHQVTNEYVDALFVAQTESLDHYFRKRTEGQIDAFIQTSNDVDRKQIFLSNAIGDINLLFTIVVSSLFLLFGSGSGVNLLYFTILIQLVMHNAQNIEQLVHQMMASHASFENVHTILQFPPRGGDRAAAPCVSLTAQNLSFRYHPDSEPILSGLHFDFRSGEAIRIRGRNGSGKSTLIKLLCGLYPPTQGEIHYNGIPIRDYSVESLRQEFCVLGQDEKILNESVEDYLALFRSDSADLAAELEQLDLPTAHTRVHGNGSSLSFGQRKKLIFSKFLTRYSSASVCIIDEIDAGLDIRTKKQIADILRQAIEKREKLFLIIHHDEDFPIPYDRELTL